MSSSHFRQNSVTLQKEGFFYASRPSFATLDLCFFLCRLAFVQVVGPDALKRAEAGATRRLLLECRALRPPALSALADASPLTNALRPSTSSISTSLRQKKRKLTVTASLQQPYTRGLPLKKRLFSATGLLEENEGSLMIALLALIE